MTTDGPRQVGRYLLFSEIASGGMASVHLARLVGAIGFSRTVAIKRLLPHFGDDPEFLAMFRDEARIAARIRHPNVVSILDVVAEGNELFLVMDYVEGESLAKLLRATSERRALVPREIVLAVICGALQGLHAAHEARSETGEPLHVVHRDVSPQNILVGVDGTSRVLDFGIAKAVGRLARTQVGHVKGKFGYMAPEQFNGGQITRSTDVYGASVVLWEALTGSRLFSGDDNEMVRQVLEGQVPPPRRVEPGIPRTLERIVMHGLATDPAKRFATALEMAHAIADLGGLASSLEVGEWVGAMAAATLAERAALLGAIESRDSRAPPSAPAARQAVAPGEQTASSTFHAAPGDGTLSATIQPEVFAARTGESTSPAPRRSKLPFAVATIVLVAALIVALALALQRRRNAAAVPPSAAASGAPTVPSATAPPVAPAPRAAPSAEASAASPPPTGPDQDGGPPPQRRGNPHFAPPHKPRPGAKPKQKPTGGMPDFGI